MRFDFSISHVPGKFMLIPDYMSRLSGHREVSCLEKQQSYETESYVKLIIDQLPATDQRLQEIGSAQKCDSVCKELILLTQQGWPREKCKVKEIARLRGQLVVNLGLLMKGNALFIPTALRQDMLSKIHGAHQGIVKCKERARDAVWWPGINTDIEKLVNSCDICAKSQNDHAETMISGDFPSRPWKKLGSDLFYFNGQNYEGHLKITDQWVITFIYIDVRI